MTSLAQRFGLAPAPPAVERPADWLLVDEAAYVNRATGERCARWQPAPDGRSWVDAITGDQLHAVAGDTRNAPPPTVTPGEPVGGPRGPLHEPEPSFTERLHAAALQRLHERGTPHW